jgi:hypothetical protein
VRTACSADWLGKLAKAGIITLTIAVLSGCGVPFGHMFGTTPPASRPCIAEIDVTLSVRHAGLLRPGWIQPFVSQVANGCSEQVVYTGLIGANSQAGTCPMETIPAVSLNGNSAHDNAARASHRTKIRNDLETLLACGIAHPEQANGTDLFGGFVNAGRLADKRPGVHVYVLSDMMEDQRPWNFYRRDFEAAQDKLLLAQVRRADLIPIGLNGAVVKAFGMGVGASKMSPTALSGMYRFWTAYFATVGANFEPGSSG